MDNYVQYHNSEAMGRSCLEIEEDDNFCIGTNKPVAQRLNGHRIWLIGGIGRPREYYLIYYFFVDRVEVDEDEDRFRYRVTGREGRYFHKPVLWNPYPWFKDFLRSQQNFSMGLRKIAPIFVEQLEELASAANEAAASVARPARACGGGFGDAETNRRVEEAAVEVEIIFR